ncbi:MAG: amino acid permease [Bacteroidales bacterium]|nr:amino acid permease [Bacteroidales bacterium]
MPDESKSRQDVKRKINLKTATGIVVANIIGSGIFITSGLIAGNLPNSFWVLMCWVFGGIIAFLGALSYSELATRMPHEGGEYHYLSRLFHPVFGFLSGWVSFIVGFSAPIASSALGFSEYFFSGLGMQATTIFGDIEVYKKAVATGIVILFTFLHYHGIRRGAAIQNFLVHVKVLLIVALIVAGFAVGNPNWDYISIKPDMSFSPENLAIGTAMMLVMFSYSGWNATAYIAGEISNPKRNILLSLIIGTIIVIVLYIGLNLFFLTAMPFVEVKNSVAIGEKASSIVFGQAAGSVISIVIAIILLSSISAFIMIGPRIYYAMAKDGLFFKFARRVHHKHEVPSYSIAIQGGVAILFVVFSTLEQLLVYLYYALNIFPILAILGLFIARKRKIGEDKAYKVVGYPVTPVLFLMATVYLAIVAFINRPLESGAALATILAGIPIYYLWVWAKRKKKESRENSIS